LTLLNVPGATLFPCGKHVVGITPAGRKKYRPAMPVPDMPTILRLYVMRAYVVSP